MIFSYWMNEIGIIPIIISIGSILLFFMSFGLLYINSEVSIHLQSLFFNFQFSSTPKFHFLQWKTKLESEWWWRNRMAIHHHHQEWVVVLVLLWLLGWWSTFYSFFFTTTAVNFRIYQFLVNLVNLVNLGKRNGPKFPNFRSFGVYSIGPVSNTVTKVPPSM